MRAATSPPVGRLLREWRVRRRLSQLELACEAEISARHVSFLETGRSAPSREMVLRLAEQLDVPLRERNALLFAAGYAPVFQERALGDAALAAGEAAVKMVLAGHEPYPALAIDRHWNLVAANEAVRRLLVGTDPHVLAPPINVLRLSLHPAGLAPRIVNRGEWRAHLLARLRREIAASGDPVLADLLDELRAFPTGEAPAAPRAERGGDLPVVVPFRLIAGDAILSFISTTTVFGTPLEVTLSEIAIESFFPADEETGRLLRQTSDIGAGGSPSIARF